VRKAIAVLICLMLLLAVGVAYNQCAQKQCDKTSCPSPCPGNCPTPTASCSSCPKASADCPPKGDCVNCDGSTCSLKDCEKVAAFTGVVRYVVSANSRVKVVAGDKGLLLRVHDECASAEALKQKLSALKRGDTVSAKFWTCAQSGKHYLVDIAAGAPAASGACCGGAGCPPTGGCAGK